MAPRRKVEFDIDKAIAAAHGRHGGFIRAAKLSKARRIEIAKTAAAASGGWPKGKKRGPSPMKGRTLARRKAAGAGANTSAATRTG